MHFEYMGEGLKMTVLGILIVFLVLVIIWIVLEGMKKMFETKPKAKKETGPVVIPATAPPAVAPVQKEVPVAAPAADDSELIAVIAAAIAASLNTNPYNIRIKSYKRISLSR